MHSPTLRLPDGAHKGERDSTDNPPPAQEAHQHLSLVVGCRLSDGPLHWHSHTSPVGRRNVPHALLPPPQRHHRHLLRRKPHPRRLPPPPHCFDVRIDKEFAKLTNCHERRPLNIRRIFAKLPPMSCYSSAPLSQKIYAVVPHYTIV